MDTIIAIGAWLLENGIPALGAIHGIFLALIAFFLLIPGEQPEKTFVKIASFLAKFSKK